MPHSRALFLGAGQFASVQLEAWQDVSGVEIVGLYNRTLSRAQPLARRFDITRVSDNFGQLLEQTRPDFVDICTAVETHLPLVRTAAEAGVDILCQKPMAPTLEESYQMAAICERHGVRLMINDNWRWQAWYREVRRLLAAGMFGEVFSVYIAMRTGDGWGPEPYARQPYFRAMERFLVFETGIHYIDTLRFLFGEVESVQATLHQRNPIIRGEDQAILVLTFQSGVTAIWDANRATACTTERTPFNGFMRLEGSDATLDINQHGEMTITRRGGESRTHAYPVPEGYRGGSTVATQRHFVECLRSGEPFETSAEDYLKTTEVVFAAYAAAESRKLHLPTTS